MVCYIDGWTVWVIYSLLAWLTVTQLPGLLYICLWWQHNLNVFHVIPHFLKWYKNQSKRICQSYKWAEFISILMLSCCSFFWKGGKKLGVWWKLHLGRSPKNARRASQQNSERAYSTRSQQISWPLSWRANQPNFFLIINPSLHSGWRPRGTRFHFTGLLPLKVTHYHSSTLVTFPYIVPTIGPPVIAALAIKSNRWWRLLFLSWETGCFVSKTSPPAPST